MSPLITTLRTFPWRRIIRLRWLVAAVALCTALGLGALLALRVLRPAAPAQILPGQSLAAEIAAAIARNPGVQAASGAYLPGDRLILYARLDEPELTRVRSWALVQLEPFAERLAAMPASETLAWVIDYGPAPAEQEVLLAPLRSANTPAAYTYLSASPALLAAPTVAPTAPAAPPLAPPATQPTAAPVAATAAPAPTSAPLAVPQPAPQEATELLATGFDGAGEADTLWRPLAGDWTITDSVYIQRNADGYDFLTLLDQPPQTHYSFETRLKLVTGAMGGGLIYNAPSLSSRNGAQLIDLDQSGAYLRWGHYDADGAYRYEGGVTLDPSIGDGQWHTMRVVTHGAASTVWMDGREVAQLSNLSASGYAGLSTSRAQVAFDDVALITLPADLNPPAPTTAAATPVASLSDDFEDGDAKGWQVLNGTWQTLEGAYRQTSPTGADLSSVSLFQGADYTATVRLQRLDGQMGAGLLFNMARRDAKAESQIVNYTQGGAVLQWGHFDEGGNFVFEGSAEVPNGSDGAWHTLVLGVADGKATFSLDGEEIAREIALTYTSGSVGLLASNGSAAFDDVQFVAR